MAAVRSIRFDRNAPVDPSAPTTTHNWYDDPSGVLASGFWASKPYKADIDYTEDEFCYILEGRVRLTDFGGQGRGLQGRRRLRDPQGLQGRVGNGRGGEKVLRHPHAEARGLATRRSAPQF